MKTALLLFLITFAVVIIARVQASSRQTKTNQLDGAWELVSGQQLPEGTRDVKIISEGHFIFAAYDAQSGKPLYSAGGTYVLKGSSYTEHMDFASDKLPAGLIGKDQPFTVKVGQDTFTQAGTLSNGKALSEVWERMN